MGYWLIMGFDIKILGDKIKAIKEAFENGRFADAMGTALNTGKDIMRNRIFDSNIDIAGNSFGQYIGRKSKQTDRAQVRALFGATKTDKKRIKSSAGLELTSYQRKRANKGRQILKKDLEFMGGLRRAIETQIENEKAVVLQFKNDLAAKIAKGQENQITNIRNGRPGTVKGTGAVRIFTLNPKEKEQVNEQGAELIRQILKPK